MNDRASTSLVAFEKAVERLNETESVTAQSDRLLIDGTIQRFEFTFELAWKTLKHVLLRDGIATTSPRDALKNGFQVGWLEDEMLWLSMMEDRNRTSHIYNEEVADEIFQRIQTYRSAFQSLAETLREKLDDDSTSSAL